MSRELASLHIDGLIDCRGGIVSIIYLILCRIVLRRVVPCRSEETYCTLAYRHSIV